MYKYSDRKKAIGLEYIGLEYTSVDFPPFTGAVRKGGYNSSIK